MFELDRWTPSGEANLSEDDHAHLSRAQELAGRGWGRVRPNPMVGCVLVLDGERVGEGWHEEHGGPHAEVQALRSAGDRARGATAYVTLEPCSHFGLTPPCTEALLEAGVRRVVYGAADPGTSSAGGGAVLTEAGVEVVGPVLPRSVAWSHNAAFFHNAEHQATFVSVKLAMTLDAKIGRARGERTHITGPEAERQTHYLRAGHDAIMVGSGTVLADDPLLTVRGAVKPRTPPVRIVVDSNAVLSTDASLFRDVDSTPLLVFTAEEAPEEKLEILEEAGAQVHPVAACAEGVDLRAVLRDCWKLGIRSILCEGGGVLASSLVRQELAQRLYLFVAPWVVGEGGVPGWPGPFSEDAWRGWSAVPVAAVLGRDGYLVFDREA